MLDKSVLDDVLGKRSTPRPFEYDQKDAILYALSIGAGMDELPFLYENTPGGLRVYPSWGALSIDLPWNAFPELGLEPARTVHTGNRIVLHRPLPPAGKFTSTGEITAAYDKRRAALLVMNTRTVDEAGELVFENEATFFYVGGGGFGGESGPKQERIPVPEGVEPDFTVTETVPVCQAALYRLNGDRNPLHIDPEAAKASGFETPILHGMCTVGYATRAIIHTVCNSDPDRFKEFKVRFSAPVLPGDTLTTKGWRDGPGRYLIQVSTSDAVVMNNAYVLVDE
jgi:acyl dehydratase